MSYFPTKSSLKLVGNLCKWRGVWSGEIDEKKYIEVDESTQQDDERSM